MKKTMLLLIGCFLITLVILGANYMMETSSAAVEKATEEKSSEDLIEDKRPEEWEEYLFPEDEVVEVRVYIDEDQYDYMVENASSELYVPASIVYNGLTLENIGIRPKGNSSLRTAISDGKEQFSFRLEFDEYVYQSLFGITAINLNNCTSDASYIREKMSYEIIEEMGLPVPGTVYCNLYINDELVGLYLSVQQIDEVFTSAWFADGDGDLYKPEGTGANLVYTDDEYSSYPGLGERTNVNESGEEAVVAMIKALSTGENLEDVLYTDLILKYHALNTAMLSLDSYMGGMFHNYYLYGEDGRYMIIPWDYNLSFGGFGSGSNQTVEGETQFYIDEPTSGAMSSYPLISALLSNEEYLEQYHEYLYELITGPLEIERFTARAEELTALIDEYVKNDPEPITSYESFQSALYGTNEAVIPETAPETESVQQEQAAQAFEKRGGMGGGGPSLISFVEGWTENMLGQLSGELASTNNGEGNQAGMMRGGNGNENGDWMARDMEMADGDVEGAGQDFDPAQMRAMNENRQPPDGFPEPPEGFEMGGNRQEPPDGFGNMGDMVQNEENLPGRVHQASLFSILIGADIGKYLLIIIAAFIVIMFSWMVKRKS
ncbi:MAG TPA: CotH kinase family protein [Thermotogota bacterium]|nr:CotH kinase family protein [Thermotogota bacterium]